MATPSRIYLDSNSTTTLDPAVLQAMVDVMGGQCSNASSIHHEGQQARALVEEARRQVALLLGATYPEVIFTSGATEANNIAIATLARHCTGTLVSTTVEHPSVLAPLQQLQAQGREVFWVPVDARGVLPSADAIVEQAQAKGAGALSIMLANNETGNVFDVAAIAHKARELGWLVHCDATQAPGRLALDVQELGVDLLSISGHKFHGPKGAGALFVSADVELAPLIVGGHQERGRRGGTENVAAIWGLGVAARLARERLETDPQHLASLRDLLWEGIAKLEPTAVRQTLAEHSLPNTLNVRFADVDGETLLINLDLEGIAVSAGSACTAGSLEPSHVVLAMGIAPEQARGSVRFSLGRNNTSEEIAAVLERLPRVLARTRTPGW